MPGAPASTRWSNSSSIGWNTDALSRPHRHSRNLEALEACLADAARARASTQTLVLGDLVGYGADPERGRRARPGARSRSRSCAATTTRSRAASSRPKGSTPSPRARRKWTLDVLTPAHRDWLGALPEGPIDVDDVVEICHGSPFDEDAYIFDELDAVRALKVVEPAALPVRPHALPGHLRAVGRCVRQRRLGRRRRRCRCR